MIKHTKNPQCTSKVVVNNYIQHEKYIQTLNAHGQLEMNGVVLRLFDRHICTIKYAKALFAPCFDDKMSVDNEIDGAKFRYNQEHEHSSSIQARVHDNYDDVDGASPSEQI